MNNLQQMAELRIKEGKEEFHFYISELGVKKAKEIMKDKSCLKVLINYINNYPEEE